MRSRSGKKAFICLQKWVKFMDNYEETAYFFALFEMPSFVSSSPLPHPMGCQPCIVSTELVNGPPANSRREKSPSRQLSFPLHTERGWAQGSQEPTSFHQVLLKAAPLPTCSLSMVPRCVERKCFGRAGTSSKTSRGSWTFVSSGAAPGPCRLFFPLLP